MPPEVNELVTPPSTDVRKGLNASTMYDLYSMTANREATIRLFKVSDNRTLAIEPKPATYRALPTERWGQQASV